MSGGLAPSKSTCYVGNLPFSLTNNDVAKIFNKFGRVVKVTILRDKITRDSKGVAFVQFIDRDSAINACKSVNNKPLFERTIKCSIAKDNGRASEFIKKKEYPDKSTCYECGEEGHLSYVCPKNLLGDREPPPKKIKKTKAEKEAERAQSMKKIANYYNEGGSDDDSDVGEDPRESSLSFAIEMEARISTGLAQEEERLKRKYEDDDLVSDSPSSNYVEKKKIIKTSSYFSDEEEEIEG